MFDANLKKRILGYIRGREKVPLQDAEDVTEDAWLWIVKNQSKYDPDRGPVWPWAKYHCQSAVAEYYRRRQPIADNEVDAVVEPVRSVSLYEHLLEVTFTFPGDLHQLVVFGYVELLEWKPGQLVKELTNQTLEDLGNRFVVEYSSHFTHDRDVVLDLLRPFIERLRGTRTPLSDFLSEPSDVKKCSAKISHWRSTVQRRIRSDLLYLQALEDLLTSGLPRPHQIVYGLVTIVHRTPQALAEKHVQESLKSLAEQFEDGCCPKKRRHLRSLVQRLFRPLHQDPSLTGRTLCDFVAEGQSPVDVFVLWSTPPEGEQP
ncbi:MAG: sigma-70 family RNA polymerase sigma factor [bacterium]|nr:sigma-70 family RNA polymerase sigma factor [bacterium]